MATDTFNPFPGSNGTLQVVKLKLWDKIMPIAFSIHSEPLISWKVIGDMLNVDHEAELSQLMQANSYVSEQIEFIRWEDPEVMDLLGHATAPWIPLSAVPLWLSGLDASQLGDVQAVRTLHFLLMVFYAHPAKTFGLSAGDALRLLESRPANSG